MPSARSLAAGIAVTLCACSGSRSERPQTTVYASEVGSTRITRSGQPVTGFYRAHADSVWKVLPAAFKDLSFPRGSQTNAEQRLFVTQEMTIQRELYDGEANSLYFDCGRTPAGNGVADEYLVTFSIQARVVPDGDTFSHVDVLGEGRARDRTRSNASAVFCYGTGKVEQMVVDAVRKRLP